MEIQKSKTINQNNKNKIKINNKDEKDNEYYPLILLDANNPTNRKEPKESNYIIDNYDYDLALIYEKRSFFRLLYIIFLSKNDLMNTFFFKSSLYLKSLRLCLFCLTLGSDFTFNTVFYFSENISEEYNYKEKRALIRSVLSNILTTLISTGLSMFIAFLIQNLTESKDKLENEFREEEEKMRKDEKYFVEK